MPDLSAEKSSRYWDEHRPRDEDRTEFGKDYDRILYSTAFRRLNGVTQVVSSDETILFHNRLTHSLKVAQVGVRIHQLLEQQIAREGLEDKIQLHGGMDSRVVRAACMGHDLGHPPFGHIAEAALQQIVSADPDKDTATGRSIHPALGTGAEYHLQDGFEGNAQTFRMVSKLAFREADDNPEVCRALNLTAGTLTALLKYPWSRHRRRQFTTKEKWSYYDPEEEIALWALTHVREQYPVDANEQRTVEAQIMDWADDISYAVHDVEDFYRTGAIPLDLLYSSSDELGKVLDYAWVEIDRSTGGTVARESVERLIDELRKTIFPKQAFRGSRNDREQLHRFASKLINDALSTTALDEGMRVRVDLEQKAVLEFFKQLTWYYVIDRPALGSVQRGEVMLIRELFRDLTAWVKDDWMQGPVGGVRAVRREKGLPVRLRDYLEISFSTDTITGSRNYSENERVSRAVVDYIVSLTERQAVELAKRLSGHSPSATEKMWF